MQSLGNDGVLQKKIKRHDFQGVFVCRLKNYGTRRACLLNLQPSRRANTPAIARLQTGKSVLGHWSGKIVAQVSRDGEKLFGHDTADCVHAEVLRTRAATAVTVEAGDWLTAAGFERLAQHILLNGRLSAGHSAL